jgi:DNA-binding IclR family transcriptional regulator
LRRAILQRLTEEIGETCGIAVPNGAEMIYYDRVQTDWPLQIHLQVGSHTPSWCTASGKLYLSSLPKHRRQRLINELSLTRYTRNTIVDVDALETELQHIKTSRLGTDNEEFVDGMVACAVPVNNSSGTLCACLFTHAPVIRKSLDSLLGYTAQLQSAAQELGYLIDNPDQ